MRRVLALTAIDLEATRLARALGLRRVPGHAWAHFRGGAIEVVAVGVGGVRLEERAGRCPRPTHVVSAGTCGALAPGLAAGALVVPEFVLTAAGIRHRTDDLPGLERAGTLLAAEGLVTAPADKARIWAETGAIAADMESGRILDWARASGLPFAAVRGVTDTARDTVPPDLAGLVEPGGRLRAARLLQVALARPRAVGDALALGRATAAALRRVAAALAAVVRT